MPAKAKTSSAPVMAEARAWSKPNTVTVNLVLFIKVIRVILKNKVELLLAALTIIVSLLTIMA